MTTEDFQYGQYFIPRDTVVVCNTYTLHFDEERYPEPYIFNVSNHSHNLNTRYSPITVHSQPDRFENDPLFPSESAKLPNPDHRDHWMYGVG